MNAEAVRLAIDRVVEMAVLQEVRKAVVVRHSAVVLSELRREARTRQAERDVRQLHHLAREVWEPTATSRASLERPPGQAWEARNKGGCNSGGERARRLDPALDEAAAARSGSDRITCGSLRRGYATSNRSRLITFVHAATKSWTNFACASELP